MSSLVFTGHRELYGPDYSDPRYSKLINRLKEVIDYYSDSVTEMIFGGAPGLDTIAMLTAYSLKPEYPNLRLILAVPFRMQDFGWNEEDTLRYEKCKQVADEIVYVDSIEYYARTNTPEGYPNPKKFKIRNEYMVDRGTYLVSVWDGRYKSGTYSCMNYARKCNNIRHIMVLDPMTLESRFEIL